mmetsp:Transcript_18055/g.50178  ORF Transcript_18055/g.50178 Transcript_18055/m.50178 type:complete len:722 (+) Transcript_18055:3-2168(+)
MIDYLYMPLLDKSNTPTNPSYPLSLLFSRKREAMNENHFIMIPRAFLTACVLLSAMWSADAQAYLKREELCPPYTEIDPLIECINIETYGELAEVIENAPSGSEIIVCPFFVRKISSLEPITVKRGIQVSCARTAPEQACIINGLGNHLVIDSAEDTLWQGFSFRSSNDHSVHVSGDVDNAERATHTFCQTSFMENSRTKDSRGGALMLARSAGTVNVVESFFFENFSKTYGAAIYSRAQQLNIIYSLFVNNKSNGYGSAVFVANGGGLMIKTTTFTGNKGRDGHDIVINPGEGSIIYEDGFDNKIHGSECLGVYDMEAKSCAVFENSPPTPYPTIETSSPTSQPTFQPTHTPTANPTRSPTANPTSPPTAQPTKVATEKPTRPPIVPITKSPVEPPTDAPVQSVTSKPLNSTTASPTATAKPPTLMPTPKATTFTGNNGLAIDIANLCIFRAIPAEMKCVEVETFKDFKMAIEMAMESGDKDVVFCGGFSIEKMEREPIQIDRDIDIRCIDTCSFSGIGPFAKVSGVSKNRLQNIKFLNSQDSSAVIITTTSAASKTTFCRTEFSRNHVSHNNFYLGGALTIAGRSGIVNVVDSTFKGNVASRGGAIHSEGFKLNVVGSKFVANNAFHSGNAIFVGDANHLFVESSTFILNTEAASRASARDGRDTSKKSYAIAMQPNRSIRNDSRTGKFDDGGSNKIVLSGSCDGIFMVQQDECKNFEK